MRALGLRQRLEPIGDLVMTFLAGRAGHARIHVGVFVRLTRDSSGEVVGGGADRQTGRGIARFLQVFQMAVRVAGFAFRGGAENGRDVC